MTPVFVVTVGDVITLGIVVIVLLLLAVLYIPDAIKRLRCKHDGGVFETRACDAICRKCGKNLGFIGAWREAHK